MSKKIAPFGSSERFLREHVDYASDECLIWPFRLGPKGYGLAVVGGTQRRANNWMCRLAHGDPPHPLWKHAAHRCGNPPCVNPRHLRWTTHRENMLDKVAHGTVNHGERNGKTSLTEADVLYIRQAPPNLRALADQFGMTKGGISKVRRGKRWGHVPAAVARPEGRWKNVQCRNGHPYDEKNTRVTPDGYRQCRTCDAFNARSRRAARNGIAQTSEVNND